MSTAISNPGTYYIYIKSDYASGGINYDSGVYSFTANTTVGQDSGNTENDSWEPNDSFDQATALLSGNEINAQLSSSSDVDIYSISIEGEGQIEVDFQPPSGVSSDAFSISVYDSNNYLINSYSSTNSTTSINNSGKYYIEVKSGNTFSNENYGLTATTKIIETIPNDEFEPNNSFSTAANISLDSNTKRSV